MVLGKVMLEMISKNYGKGKIQRILGEEASPMVSSKYFYKFDMQIVEGTLTETQQKMQFVQMLEMQQMGIPIPPDVLIKAAPLQDKKELLESIQAQTQQQQQQEQMQMGAQLELLKAQIEDLKAKAVANTGLGVERVSRVDENRALAVERRAEAVKDHELGALHLVRALKELEGMDLANVLQAVEAVKAVQAISAAESAPTIEEVSASTEEVPSPKASA